MPAKYLPHPSLHFCQIGFVGAGFVVEEGGGYFDVAGVWDADYDGAGDGWVGYEAFFDFEGVDVFAALFLLVLRCLREKYKIERRVRLDERRRETNLVWWCPWTSQ
jgi:hypothetical protein